MLECAGSEACGRPLLHCHCAQVCHCLFYSIMPPDKLSSGGKQFKEVRNQLANSHILIGNSQARCALAERSAPRALALIMQHAKKRCPGWRYTSLLLKKHNSKLRQPRKRDFGTSARVPSAMVQALVERYGVREDELRVYVHYQPSYYHLHVHFLHVKYDAGPGMAVGKAHLLNDIIGANLALEMAGMADIAPW